MISRRHFIQFLGLGAAYMSTGFSVARAAYNKSVITLSDFGGLIQKPIKGFAEGVDEAKEIIASNGKIHPRGTGHSSMGQSIRAETFSFTPEAGNIKLEGDYVIASAGTMLLDIDNFLLPEGRMLPVSPDHRTLSLGGVLSVGGCDMRSFKYSALITHVHSLDLMDHDGNVYKDVPLRDKRALRVLAGAGKYDIILAAKIRTIKKPVRTLMKNTPFRTTKECADMTRAFVKENSEKYNEGKDLMDTFYAVWFKDIRWIVRGQSLYPDTPINPFLQEGAESQDDMRAFRKTSSDRWVFNRPFKYHIWSDHSVSINDIDTQIDLALKLKEEGEKMGGDILMNSLLIKTHIGHQYLPNFFNEDYVVSVGLYGNFLEGQEAEAEAFSKLQIEYSKEAQLNRAAKPYLAGWYWKNEEETHHGS